MPRLISVAELARKLEDVLGMVRDGGETFIVERNGEPVARVSPIRGGPARTIREVVAAWRATGEPDPSFADDLERISAADRPPRNPWVW